jgi:hypothetical protein
MVLALVCAALAIGAHLRESATHELVAVSVNSSVVNSTSTHLWVTKAAEANEYVSVQLREELPLLGPDWDDGATIGELRTWVASALFQAAPLLSRSQTGVELRMLVPFEVSLARPGQELASCSTGSAAAAKLPLPFASEDEGDSLLDAATLAPTTGQDPNVAVYRSARPDRSEDVGQRYAPTLAATVFEVVREAACSTRPTNRTMRDEIHGATPFADCDMIDGMHMPAPMLERMRWQPTGAELPEYCESLHFSISYQPEASYAPITRHSSLTLQGCYAPLWLSCVVRVAVVTSCTALL